MIPITISSTKGAVDLLREAATIEQRDTAPYANQPVFMLIFDCAVTTAIATSDFNSQMAILSAEE